MMLLNILRKSWHHFFFGHPVQFQRGFENDNHEKRPCCGTNVRHIFPIDRLEMSSFDTVRSIRVAPLNFRGSEGILECHSQ